VRLEWRDCDPPWARSGQGERAYDHIGYMVSAAKAGRELDLGKYGVVWGDPIIRFPLSFVVQKQTGEGLALPYRLTVTNERYAAPSIACDSVESAKAAAERIHEDICRLYGWAPRSFDMDGSEHREGDERCCHGEGRHEGCGGLWHFQAVYGGQFHECDRCHETK
jgi:hypothetical protein